MKSVEALLQQLEITNTTLSKFQLGYLYDKGELVSQDNQRAFQYYVQAAKMEKSDANELDQKYKVFAIYNVGVMHLYGRGTEENLPEALTWINRAAESGNIDAWWRLGQMYEIGQGVAKNYDEAYKCYLLAANHNHAAAQFNIGKICMAGLNKVENYEKAKEWFQKAAEQGAPDAQYELGMYYLKKSDLKEFVEDTSVAAWGCIKYISNIEKLTTKDDDSKWHEYFWKHQLRENKYNLMVLLSNIMHAKVWLTKALYGECYQSKAKDAFKKINNRAILLNRFFPELCNEQESIISNQIEDLLKKSKSYTNQDKLVLENLQSLLLSLTKTGNFEEYQQWYSCILVENLRKNIWQSSISTSIIFRKTNMITGLLQLETFHLNYIIQNIDMSPLELVIEQGDVSGVQILLKHKYIDVNFNYPLLKAVTEGQVDITILLLSNPDIDVNISKEISSPTPLWTAAKYGFLEIVQELLLHPKIYVDYQCGKLNAKELKCLEEFGRDKMSAQEVALCYNHEEIVNLLQAHKEALAVKRARIKQRNLQSTGSSSSMFNHQSQVHFMFASSKQVQRAFNQQGSTQQDIELDEFDENNTLATATDLQSNIKLHV